MKDKERLDDIKWQQECAEENGVRLNLSNSDILYLIKQAEKLVKLEENNNQINEWDAMSQIAESSMKANGYTADDVHAELKRMRSERNTFENIREKFQNQMKNKGVSYTDVLESIENEKNNE